MNRTLSTAAILAAIALTPAPEAAAGAPAYSADINAIKPYVYPANAPAAPAAMTYLADGASYAVISDDGKRITRHDIRTGKELAVMLDLAKTRETTLDSRIEGFSLSANEQYILIHTGRQSIYRHSFAARYYVYEVRHNILKPLSAKFETQRAPIFSPDSRIVAFTAADNNIHLAKLDYGTETDVTTDGQLNSIINGVPDWVYEEELGTECSMAWAPDGLTLCYLKYDESKVPQYSFPLYEGTCNPRTSYALYPGDYTYKYPVAGEPNSKVSLHSYDIDTRKTKRIDFDDLRIEYIPRIEFAPGTDRLIVATLNRPQTRMEIYSVNPKSTVVRSIYVDEAKQGWLDPSAWEQLRLQSDGFVVQSERTGYNHLYLYSYAGALTRQITSGDFDVTAYYGFEGKTPATQRYFYQSTANGAINRTVSAVDLKGRVATIGPEKGSVSASFSPDMAYMTLAVSDAATPPAYDLYATKGMKRVRHLLDNSAYLASYPKLPAKEFFTMTTDGGVTLNGFMIKPADFNASRRYPVIMSQYSGPGSQEVLNRWTMNWDYYFASKGYIVITVDGRGTGGRGRDFKTIVYRSLGHYETIDQVAAARYAASLPYVDASRIGIYGWSYGGYETLMAASAPDCPYRAAVAVAPVTSWRYYDSIYTERYMLTPRENEDGYYESSPINHVGRMNIPLLIMHGTADDNVHLSNTIEYVSALQASGRMCDMLLFPNMNHSIYGCGARALVYVKMLQYFDQHMR